MYRKEGLKRGKGVKERKTCGVKKISVLARPLTSAYICLYDHKVRAYPASSAAIKLPVPTQPPLRLPTPPQQPPRHSGQLEVGFLESLGHSAGRFAGVGSPAATLSLAFVGNSSRHF